jgi:hypothetical protein
MLSRLIVATYPVLIEIFLWLALVLASIAGYEAAVPTMQSAGLIPTYEFAWKIIGALAFPVIAFLFLALAFGPLLALLDLRQAVRNIEAKARGEVTSLPPFMRKEPT